MKCCQQICHIYNLFQSDRDMFREICKYVSCTEPLGSVLSELEILSKKNKTNLNWFTNQANKRGVQTCDILLSEVLQNSVHWGH